MSVYASSSFATDVTASTVDKRLPYPLLPSLNDLLALLLIPITLTSLSLATPSLLLSVLESLLETRFTSVSQEVRTSWERPHRTEVATFLVEALAQVLEKVDGDVGRKLRQVEVSSVVKGREQAVSVLVDGLLGVAKRMGMVGGHFGGGGHHVEMVDDHSRASTPTPGPSRPLASPPQSLTPRPHTSTPPARPSSSLSTSSRVSLRHVVALSPPLSAARPPPLTPRSQLRLQGLANALAADRPRRDRPPLFVPPAAAPSGEPEILRPVPRRAMDSFDGEDPFASRRVELESEVPRLRGKERRRKAKGKGREVEEVCDCGASFVGVEEEVEVCTCAENHDMAPHTSREAGRKPAPQPRYRHPPTNDSSASDDPPPLPAPGPSPQPSTHFVKPSAALSSHPHRRAKSTSAQSQRPPPRSTPAQPAVHHVHSGYLSVVGESEIDAFERTRRHQQQKGRNKPGLGSRGAPSEVTGDKVLKLEPPTGWSWVKVDHEALAGLSTSTSSRPEPTPRRPKETSPETPSPYTLLLLSQRARLSEKLQDLKLSKMEQERGRPYLEESTEAEEPRVVVRRRVERVGDGWWRE